MNQNTKNQTILIIGLIVLAAFARLIPHSMGIVMGFSPIIALSIFGGANLKNRKLAYLIPIGVMLLTDIFIGMHSTMWAVYGAIALGVLIGGLISKNITAPKVVGASLSSSVIFFVITNFAVWMQFNMYPHTFEGLQACYVAAIPFFRTALLGDLIWSVVLFGSYALAKNHITAFADAK